jgi:hypothetical protein
MMKLFHFLISVNEDTATSEGDKPTLCIILTQQRFHATQVMQIVFERNTEYPGPRA